MFVTIALVVLSQFKADDVVYIKGGTATGYLTEKLARVRYEPPYGQSVSASEVANQASGGTELIVHWPKFTQVKVLTTTSVDGDKLVRVHHVAWKMSYWYHAEDVGLWTKDTELQAKSDVASESQTAKMQETIQKLSPYIKNQNERQAISAAFAAGLNPLNMTAKEASVLSTGQRRAISTVRQRFTKGNRINAPAEDQ